MFALKHILILTLAVSLVVALPNYDDSVGDSVDNSIVPEAAEDVEEPAEDLDQLHTTSGGWYFLAHSKSGRGVPVRCSPDKPGHIQCAGSRANTCSWGDFRGKPFEQMKGVPHGYAGLTVKCRGWRAYNAGGHRVDACRELNCYPIAKPSPSGSWHFLKTRVASDYGIPVRCGPPGTIQCHGHGNQCSWGVYKWGLKPFARMDSRIGTPVGVTTRCPGWRGYDANGNQVDTCDVLNCPGWKKKKQKKKQKKKKKKVTNWQNANWRDTNGYGAWRWLSTGKARGIGVRCDKKKGKLQCFGRPGHCFWNTQGWTLFKKNSQQPMPYSVYKPRTRRARDAWEFMPFQWNKVGSNRGTRTLGAVVNCPGWKPEGGEDACKVLKCY